MRYVALLDSADLQRKSSAWVVLLIPLTYFLRRAMLCFCLVFWLEFFWGQVAIQLMISVCMMIFLQWARPLDSAFANNIETFNEVVTLLVIYLLMCFSDFVISPETRNDCGKVFICRIQLLHS